MRCYLFLPAAAASFSLLSLSHASQDQDVVRRRQLEDKLVKVKDEVQDGEAAFSTGTTVPVAKKKVRRGLRKLQTGDYTTNDFEVKSVGDRFTTPPVTPQEQIFFSLVNGEFESGSFDEGIMNAHFTNYEIKDCKVGCSCDPISISSCLSKAGKNDKLDVPQKNCDIFASKFKVSDPGEMTVGIDQGEFAFADITNAMLNIKEFGDEDAGSLDDCPVTCSCEPSGDVPCFLSKAGKRDRRI